MNINININKNSKWFEILKVIKNNIEYNFRNKIGTKIISDEDYIKKTFKKTFNREINLKNPKTLNEKINWRMLNDRNPIYSELSDKYLVRRYVGKKIGEKYLAKLYGVWNEAEQIEFLKLPDKFVLKANHDSGSTIICKENKNLNQKKIIRKLKTSLARNHYYWMREWHYKNIKPVIIAEELLETFGEELIDYKFHCFQGEVEVIQVANSTHTGNNLYNDKWELQSIKYGNENFEGVNKPKKLDEMLNLAKILSKEFSYVRVDFYNIDERIIFGEMTFTPNSGIGKFNPEKWDYHYGEKFLLTS